MAWVQLLNNRPRGPVDQRLHTMPTVQQALASNDGAAACDMLLSVASDVAEGKDMSAIVADIAQVGSCEAHKSLDAFELNVGPGNGGAASHGFPRDLLSKASPASCLRAVAKVQAR